MAEPIRVGIVIHSDGTAQVSGDLVRLQTDLNNTGNAVANSNRQFAAMARQFTSMAGAFGLMFGAAGFAALARDVLKTNVEMEGLRARLKSVTGSADEAARSFSFIVKFAKETPFEIKGLTQAYITLQNFGIKPTIQVMDALTNQAARSGASTENLSGIAIALGQAWGKGKLQGQEILQLINQAVPVYDLLSRVTGANSTQLFDMAEKGLLTRDVISALIAEMGKMAAGANANAMDTLNGKISSLSDAWHTFEDTLLQDKSEGVLKSIVTSLTHALDYASMHMSQTLDDRLRVAEERMKRFDAGLLGKMMPSAGAGLRMDVAELQYQKRIEAQKNTESNAAQQQFTKAMQDQVRAAEEATKVREKLIDANKKLTLSQHDYQKQQLEGLGIKGKELQDLLALADANAALIDSQKDLADAERQAAQEAERAQKAVQSAYANAVRDSQAYLQQLQSELDQIGMSAQQKADYAAKAQAAIMAENGLERAAIVQFLTNAHAKNAAIAQTRAAQDLQTAAINAEKNAMASVNEEYARATKTAREFLAYQLSIQNVPAANQVGILEKFDQTKAAESAKKHTDDARLALDAYAKSLGAAQIKTSDLGAVTSAVFDGALGGINTMAGAFDHLVDAIDKSAAALRENAQMQELNNSQADSAEKYANSVKFARQEQKINADLLRDKLSAARQITAATESMFKKGSTAQRAAHAITMAIAGVEMAQTLLKITGIGAVTAAEAASVAPAIAASTAKGTAKAAEAVATQATAGPYIGFALMAAMAVAMAAIGFGVGGGSGASVPIPTGTPDTETVLGDPTAKSESIDRTYELLKTIHAEEYAELRGINAGVSALSNGITNAVTRLFQSGGLREVSAGYSGLSPTAVAANAAVKNIVQTAIGTLVGPAISKMLGSVVSKDPVLRLINNFLLAGIFGRIKSEIVGSGIATSAARFGEEIIAQQYATIQTTKKSWFSKKVTFSEVLSPLDAEVSGGINKIFKSIYQVTSSLSNLYFKDAGLDVSEKIKKYIIPALHIELKDLSGKDAAKKLNNVISAQTDKMAEKIFGSALKQYQKLGEGMFETATRVASELAIVKDALAISGIALRNDAIAISQAMITAAGGLEAFQSQFSTYYDKFFTDAEKQARLRADLDSQLSNVFGQELAASILQSRDAFKNLMSSLDVNAIPTHTIVDDYGIAHEVNDNSSNQERYSLMLKLAGAADQYYQALEDGASTATDAAKKAADELAAIAQQQHALDIQLMEATGDAAGALAAKRADELAAMDASLRGTQQAIYAANDLADAQKAAAATAKALSVWQDQLDVLIGAKTQTQIDRATALAAVTDTAVIAIMNQVYALQDLAASTAAATEAAKVLQGWQDQLDVLTGAKTQTQIDRAAALAGVTDAATLAVMRQVFAQQDLAAAATSAAAQTSKASGDAFAVFKKSVDAERTKISAGYNSALASAQSATDSLTASVSKLSSLSSALRNSLNAMVAPNQDALTRAQAQATISSALILAKTGGFGSINEDMLNKALSDVAKPSEDLFADFNSYRRDYLATAIDIASLADLADGQLSTGNAQLDASKAQIQAIHDLHDAEMARLDKLLDFAQAQVDAANGTSVATMDVGAAIAGLVAALNKQVLAQQADVGGSYAPSQLVPVPGFAAGGIHAGGWRIVGENGPELEHTGPSNIISNSNSKALFDNSALIVEIKALREELRAGQGAIAINTRKTAQQLERWDADGLPETTA